MDQPENQLNLAALLRIPFQALVDELHRRLAEAGYGDIRPAHTIIFALLGSEGMRLSELTARAQTTKQVMNYLINSVEKNGYVERLPDPADGRAKIVRLTARGLEASQAGRKILFSLENEWAQDFGEKEMRELRLLLLRLVTIVGQLQTDQTSLNDD
jgi:DNA-binding MarR family transcriptional regulator